MFLGADTIKPLLKRLVPEAQLVSRPRFSTLSYTGEKKLQRLPPRSAVVAFAVAEVFELAEAIRRRRGGTAVVMGALSPRARNAQVGMFQAGEVDYMVATDAIGMGLNMDLDHVAFAKRVKFDGRAPRRLSAPEIAQIAGRAGRHMSDGTFGVTADERPLEPELVEAIEEHRFDPLQRLYWRNAKLDFSSVRALLNSLDARPRLAGLVATRDRRRSLRRSPRWRATPRSRRWRRAATRCGSSGKCARSPISARSCRNSTRACSARFSAICAARRDACRSIGWRARSAASTAPTATSTR